jgi:hypothetical protein
MSALTASKQSEVRAWEAEIVACEHIHQLKQLDQATLSEQSRSNIHLALFSIDIN